MIQNKLFSKASVRLRMEIEPPGRNADCVTLREWLMGKCRLVALQRHRAYLALVSGCEQDHTNTACHKYISMQ